MEQRKPEPLVTKNDTAIPRDGYVTVCDAMGIEAVGFCLDENLTILWASGPFCRNAGYTKEGFHSQFPDFRAYYTSCPDGFEYIKSHLNEAVLQKLPEAELTVPVPVREGDAAWGRMMVTFAGLDQGGYMECRAFYKAADSGYQKLEEENRRLRETSGYFKWVLDEFSGNAYIADIETYELLYINRTSSETLQLQPGKVIGRKCYEVVQNRTSPCPFCNNSKLRRDGFYEWEYYNPYLKHTYMLKDRLIDWDGRDCRLEISIDNLSPEYKLEKMDREREAILRTIPGGFARVDARDGRTVTWYGGDFLHLIGYTKEQFENELHSQCSYIHPDDLSRASTIMYHSKETGKPTAAEGRIITRDGTQKVLTMTFSYMSAENSWDGIESFYSIGIDITKDRELQERQRNALEEAYQVARVANAAKTNFLSSMSHDIRTPMNAIMGMTTIAHANLESPEKIRDCLEKIKTSSRHLLSLINEVLDMSKIESGKVSLALAQMNLPDMIQEVMDMCRPLVNEKHQLFRISIGRVRHENVIADGDRLRQVLMNLLSNAIKYTQEGGTITLRINERSSLTPDKRQYEFICTDNGIGISKDYLPHIFDAFTRAEDSRVSKIQGTGLGMAITENIVRMMNGIIDVKSEEGAGSTVTVSVPLEVCHEEDAKISELSGRTVLVVDSDPVICGNARQLVDELGLSGDYALSGEEAIGRIMDAHEKGNDYFAIILDWNLPGPGGPGVMAAVQKSLGRHRPVMIVSSNDFSEIEAEYLKSDADAFIIKPLFKSKLLQVLELFAVSDNRLEQEIVEEEKTEVLSGRKVLLAEDNDINREIVEELLRMHHMLVDSVENGQLARDAFEASAPGEYGAILMDIQMPVMNGYDASAAIRRMDREDARTIPIIALTANAFTSDVSKAHSAGMNDHLAKPIEIERLLEVLQKWMGQEA